jgi:hypothetical protein
MSKTVILPVRLQESDREEIDRIAELENLDASNLVRAALAEYMRSRSDNFSGRVLPANGARENGGRPRGAHDKHPRKRRAS